MTIPEMARQSPFQCSDSIPCWNYPFPSPSCSPIPSVDLGPEKLQTVNCAISPKPARTQGLKQLFTFLVKRLHKHVLDEDSQRYKRKVNEVLLLYAQCILTQCSSLIPELFSLSVYLHALYVGL